LPPGFEGSFHRSTESQIAFVIEGEGELDFDGSQISWREMDSLSLPNWQRRRFINRSRQKRSVLFVLSDRPILDALGYFRSEKG
jgi:gentisate 1,2-dioxygenase